MAGHRRDEKNARLRHIDVLFEMEKRAERRDERGLFRNESHAMAHDHFVDAERRPLMRQPRAAYHLGARRHAADNKIAQRPRLRFLQQRTGQIRRYTKRRQEVLPRLIELIKHALPTHYSGNGPGSPAPT